MKLYLFPTIFILSLLPFSLWSQSTSIKGVIKDKQGNEGISIGFQSDTTANTTNDTSLTNVALIAKDKQLREVVINGVHRITGMGYLSEVHDGIIYSGQKNEVILLDSLDANTAQDNPRQTLGRIPGSNYSETEGNGFPANGIGFRGLNPTQSIETNTRQNGYNIAGDVYGYPESYYLPPLEAIERVEVVRGASSLQFGPQFGGVVNYIVKNAPANIPMELTTEQTVGSYGAFNSFNAIGGTIKKWNYYAFLDYKYEQGWRPNSQMQQGTAFARVEYRPNARFKVGIEYSLLRNLLHMPGGLDDSTFRISPRASFRARNWLATPWNILAFTASYHLTDKVAFTLKSALNISARNIVWRNEDGGPEASDNTLTAQNTYTPGPREIEHEYFRNLTNEIRLLAKYNTGKHEHILAAGIRFYDGWMQRKTGGVGSTGSDPDFTNYSITYAKNLDFTTINVAPFVENTFHLGQYLSITPGIRFEYIKSIVSGTVTDSTGSYLIPVNATKARNIPLAGLAVQYRTSGTSNIYGNISQAYTPIAYSFLYPLGLDIDAKIDPNLKDITGYNADLGWRGNIKNFLNFDISAFYMAYNHTIAIETQKNNNNKATYFETNVGDAVHQGMESYIELSITKLLRTNPKAGQLSFFNSFAYDDARYVNGLYKGNVAEYAPATIERFGVTYTISKFSTTFLLSSNSSSYSDANNNKFTINAESGIIPAYQVMDWSSTIKLKNYKIKFGINNLTDTRYFTLRTIEYPGPGIIPSSGRSFYVGFGAKF